MYLAPKDNGSSLICSIFAFVTSGKPTARLNEPRLVSLIAPGGQHEDRSEGDDDLWSLGLSNQRQLYQQDGEYYVPGHPGVRVQVKVGSPHEGEYPVPSERGSALLDPLSSWLLLPSRIIPDLVLTRGIAGFACQFNLHRLNPT